jgi:hypothetical protein
MQHFCAETSQKADNWTTAKEMGRGYNELELDLRKVSYGGWETELVHVGFRIGNTEPTVSTQIVK